MLRLKMTTNLQQVLLCRPCASSAERGRHLLWKRSTDSLSFPARFERKASPVRPRQPSKRMISSAETEREKKNMSELHLWKSFPALNRIRDILRLTRIVFSYCDEVEQAVAGEQLCYSRQEPVCHLSALNPSGPGSLDTCAAHLKGKKFKLYPRFFFF